MVAAPEGQEKSTSAFDQGASVDWRSWLPERGDAKNWIFSLDVL
jgi:hypothetical protein